MRFIKKGRKRWIALGMALVMAFTAVSWDMLRKDKSKAAESNKSSEYSESDYLNDLALLDYSEEEMVELKEERTKNSTTYSLGNGFKKVVYYSGDVRFENKDGQLVDYDSSLKEIKPLRGKRGYKYENSNGDNKNYLPTDIEKTPVRLENKKYSIELSPVFKKSQDNEFANIKDMASAKAIVEEFDDIYDETKNAVVGAEYVSSDKKMEIEYISSDKGIKENIVLNSKPQTNVWKFTMNLGTLIPKLDKETGIIYIYDGNDIVGQIDKPFMNDATGEAYSEDISYEIKNLNGRIYELTMTADKEYFESPDREYPVTIDPTLSWCGQEQIYDVYISNTDPNSNLYGRKSIRTGTNNTTTYRTYMLFRLLKTQLEEKSIASANLTVYEGDESQKGQVIEAFRVTENWDKSQITWNSCAKYDEKPIASIVSTGQGRQASSFDMTSFVRGAVKDQYNNYGIMLKAKDDTKSAKYGIFYGSKNEVTECMPRLEVVYYDRPTTANVSLEKRFIKPGEKLKVTWDGIVSQALDLVQYRLASYDLENHEETGDEILYSYDTVIGNTAAGSAVIEESKNWKEGEHKIVVRGYDKFKMGGVGKGVSFVIDGTKPSLSNVSISQDTNENNYSSKLPVIEWSGASDKYFQCVEYSVNDGTYIELGNTENGKAELSSSQLNETGKYNIKVRAIDKAGNTSDVKEFNYYYDGKAPVFTSFTTVPVEAGNVANPLIAWNIDETFLSKVQCSVNGGEYFDIGTKNEDSYVLKEGIITKQGVYSIKLRAIDQVGNISEEKEIKYNYTTAETDKKEISIVPSESDKVYTNIEPTITVTGINGQGKVKIAYKLMLNGDVVNEEIKEAEIAAGVAFTTVNKNVLNKSGDYILEVNVTDEQGNSIANYKNTYLYDAVAPEVKDVRIINLDPKEVPTIIANGITDDKSGVGEEVVCSIVPSYEDKEIKEYAHTASAKIDGKNISFTLNKEDIDITDGIYKVLFAIKDKSGNRSQMQSVGYYKFTQASFTGKDKIEANYNKDTNKIDISWEDNEKIQEARIYARYGKGQFQYVDAKIGATSIAMPVEDIEKYKTVDYRVLFGYNDGTKTLSDIVSMTKSDSDSESNESEGESKDNSPKYESIEVDEDEDGLADGYEIWDLSSNPNEKDTDGDGFDDRYEVTTLGTSPAVVTPDKDSDGDGLYDSKEYAVGTDPYLQDSDFDGIPDAQDSQPVKTDLKSGREIKYTQDIHVGVYDRQIETIEKDGTKTITVENVYTGKVKQVNIDGKITSYYYDSNDNNTAVIGRANDEYVVNTYSYNKDNNLTYLTHNGFGYEFNYDNDGNMSDIVAANRTLVSYKYKKSSKENDEEKEDLMSTMTYGNNFKYDYEYDNNDNITVIKIDNNVLYEMSYDDKGNMTKQVDKANGITYEYGYDGEGNVTYVKGSDGFNISYVNKKTETVTEDGDNINKSEHSTGYTDGDTTRICNTTTRENTTAKTNQTTTVLIDKNTLEYVVNDNNKTETKTIKDKNGNNLVYTVTSTNDDGSKEVRNINGDNLSYKYDKNENITSIVSSDGSAVTYEYDELDQLVRENDSKAGTTTLYTYDKGGNVTSQRVYTYTTGQVTGDPIKVKNYEYKDSDWRDLLTSYNGQVLTYDEIGNPIQYRDGMKLAWTNGRSLKNVTKGELNTSYKYNKDGIRTEKTVNGKTTKYTLEDKNIVKETTDGKTTWYIYDGNGDIVGLEVDGTSYYYDKNIQGDIIGIYDTMGARVVSYRYDAWGNVISVEGNKELASKNPFRYRGYYYDEEIGLYYLNSRYYDAETGRFVNADDVNLIPTMQSGIKGTNLFEYCDDNPVNKDDPTGQWPSTRTIINKLWKAMKVLWCSFWTILGFIGNMEIFYKYFLPKSIKQRFTKKYIANKFIDLIYNTRSRWRAFKASIRSLRFNWKIGVAILATIVVTTFTVIVYSCKRRISVR